MRSLRKTVLLAVLVSVVLVLALLHSWPTRAYSTVDVSQHPLSDKNLEERLPELQRRVGDVGYHLREGVAR